MARYGSQRKEKRDWRPRRKLVDRSIIIGGWTGWPIRWPLRTHEWLAVAGIRASRHAEGMVEYWKRKSYLIDGGIQFLMSRKHGSSAHELYRQLGVAQASRFVDLTTYSRLVDEASERSVLVTEELNRPADELKAMSPVDTPNTDGLIAGAYAMQRST